MDERAAKIERLLQRWSKWSPIVILVGLGLSVLFMVLSSPDMVSELKTRASLGKSPQEFQIEAVNYGDGRSKSFDADFYHPQSSSSPGARSFPAVVVVHGGAWRSGDRFEMNDVCRFFAANGYGVLNIETPLNGSGGGFPHDIVSAKDAVTFLINSSEKFHIDRNRIFLLGLSSGAHVALMAAYTPNEGRFAPSAKTLAGWKVRAVAAISPPTELTGVRDNLTREYLEAGGLKANRENLSLASPLSYVSGAVPTVLMHGDADKNVPYNQSQLLIAALTKHKVRCHLVTISGADHFIMGESKSSGLKQLLDFFNQSRAQ